MPDKSLNTKLETDRISLRLKRLLSLATETSSFGRLSSGTARCDVRRLKKDVAPLEFNSWIAEEKLKLTV